MSLVQLRVLVAFLLFVPFLSGCLLMADRQEQATINPEDGSQEITFFSSDTNGATVEEALDIGTQPMLLDVTFRAQVDSGEFVLDVLNGERGDVAFTLKADKQGVSGRAVVMTNDVGDLRWRIRTVNARKGVYNISYQPPPTPTPTPTNTPTAIPTNTPTPTPTATPVPTDTAVPTEATATP